MRRTTRRHHEHIVPACPALLEASGLTNFGSPECKILRVAAIQVDRLAKTGSVI